MPIRKSDFVRYIKQFQLKELFIELGWDHAKATYPVMANDKTFTLKGIAEKKGFAIFLCESANGSIPDSATRRKIDQTITKLHHEHLIIYTDANKTRQRWELLIREENKPAVCRPVDYYKEQEPELLFQKLEGLFFSFDDEEKLTIVDVRSRVMANFEKNAEVVTKKFYEKFSKEHEKFLGFIKGIQSKVDQEWYASLMLNRLMFIYFIQKKGFLDNDRDYLRNRLKLVQQKKGKGKFYSFYRSFLLVLFHKGLGSPLRDTELEAEIGKVPYLNGGLFDVHKLEKDNKDITIEDKAFERIFDFFDEYNWHLDTRITATGRDISPDVIGYIFEKYINDRAAMGAYYTKEDITEYISKNCIVPWLFDEVKRNYPKPFVPNVFASDAPKGQAKQSDQDKKEIASPPSAVRNDSVMSIWSFLQQSGDTYIYPAVKHGIPNPTVGTRLAVSLQVEEDYSDLPEDVRSCIDPNTPDLVEKRKCWNRSAPGNIALPTEIYREVIARRKRYYEVRKKIEQGEIADINDFITYNLNIRQFAQDVLEQTDDPKLVMEFYKAVKKITVLDPTCGSGAFLFAALNVLEPLYYACVTRMREFVETDGKGKHKFFEEQLAIISADDPAKETAGRHPNEEYFIYKSIILHNLYGVDIMKEAVEIAKLRLFLKLVATVDVDYRKPNLGLEPLPDIDFNIRSGNTLVGYATLADLDKSAQGGLFGDEEKQAILEEADVVSRAYARFKDAQLVMHSDPKSYKDAKDDLNKRLSVLNDKLNRYLAVTYLGPSHSKAAYEKWLASHQPFHWLAEYYWIIAEGGFDVIIGNPPYVEYEDVETTYKVKDYKTIRCGDLYSFVCERSIEILNDKSRIGVIVPVSIVSTDGFADLRNLFKDVSSRTWTTHFAERPSKLFVGVEKRLCVWLAQVRSGSPTIFTSHYWRWMADERDNLFAKIQYVLVSNNHALINTSIPKIHTDHEVSILSRMSSNEPLKTFFIKRSVYPIYYTRKVRYFVQFFDFVPAITDEDGKNIEPSELKELHFADDDTRYAAISILNSSLFFWFFSTFSDVRNLNRREIEQFRCTLAEVGQNICVQLKSAAKELMSDFDSNSLTLENNYGDYGTLKIQSFQPRLSKPIIDEIDKVLAKHYGFTPEELDFIINYDIKYRMGKELEGE